MAGRFAHWIAGAGGPSLSLLLRALGVAAAMLVLWEAAVLILAPPDFMLPPPDRVFRKLIERPDLWLVHAPVTLAESVIGLVTGSVLGAGLALLMALLPLTKRVVLPVMVVSQALPVFALAPLLALWFGFGLGAKVAMATIAIFFPVASAFADGLSRTDPNLIDLARLYRAGRWETVTLLRIPSALPALITGVRLAAVYAPVGALFGEWVGGSSGLGYAMLFANGRSQTDVMFAALLLLAAMSVLLRALIDLVTANLTPWAPESA